MANLRLDRIDWQSLRLRIRHIVPDVLGQPSALDPSVYLAVNEALRFVDSIAIRIPYCLQDPRADGLLKGRCIEKSKDFVLWKYTGLVKTLSDASVSVTYLPFTREQTSYVTLVFSVQKVVQGNNYRLIPYGTDIIRRLDEELLRVLEQLGIPPVSVLEFEIRRIDISLCWQVGEDLYRYLDFIRTRVIARRERADFNNVGQRRPSGIDPHTNGTCFYSTDERITVYAKEQECKNPLADGLFRLEPSYRKPKAVEKLFQASGILQFPDQRAKVKDLCMSIIEKACRNALFLTGLGNTIASRKTLYERLLGVFSPREARGMMSFILHEQQYPGKPTSEAAELYHCSAETVRRKRKLLRDAEISAWGDEAYDLPGLRLDILDGAAIVLDDHTGWPVVTAPDGESCGEVPHNIFPASRRMISSSSPVALEVVAADALVSELFGRPTILVVNSTRIALGPGE